MGKRALFLESKNLLFDLRVFFFFSFQGVLETSELSGPKDSLPFVNIVPINKHVISYHISYIRYVEKINEYY